MDELTPMGSADVVEVTQNNINRYCLEPKDLGISRWDWVGWRPWIAFACRLLSLCIAMLG